VRLTEPAKFDGRAIYRNDLERYARHKLSSDWETIETVDLPSWAYAEEEIY